MFTKVNSSSVFGLEAYLVETEVDLSAGLPSFVLVGLPDAAVKESKERVYSAIKNSGYQNPIKKITINLAPADILKKGTLFDLPIAIGILASSGQIEQKSLQDTAFIGELALNGKIRRVNGALPMCLKLKADKIKRVLLPKANAKEAALVKGLDIIAVEDLKMAVSFLNNELAIKPFSVNLEELFFKPSKFMTDFQDIKGQVQAKRALEISAAGGHNVLMVGSPGSGKTLLARSMPSILPPLELEEALEITKLYSVSGLLSEGQALINHRVFRSPHHTISDVGLIGGGKFPKPGEVSLANLGVLFLDELPEFSRNVLEVLRQPMEDGIVTISRALTSITYPASFTLVSAMNPCPCGNYLDPVKSCSCNPFQIQRYWAKLSGPLLDRIDIHIEVPRLTEKEMTELAQGESSDKIRQRVIKARERQKQRFLNLDIFCNSQMNTGHIRKFCELSDASLNLIKAANQKYNFSARAYDRILKTARTIADLQDSEAIEISHVAEALQYKSIDKSNKF